MYNNRICYYCTYIIDTMSVQSAVELYFGGKRGVAAICACCVFTRDLPGGGRRRRHGASDSQLFPVRRSADSYCQQSARARARELSKGTDIPSFPATPCSVRPLLWAGPVRSVGFPPIGIIVSWPPSRRIHRQSLVNREPWSMLVIASRPLTEKPPTRTSVIYFKNLFLLEIFFFVVVQ